MIIHAMSSILTGIRITMHIIRQSSFCEHMGLLTPIVLLKGLSQYTPCTSQSSDRGWIDQRRYPVNHNAMGVTAPGGLILPLHVNPCLTHNWACAIYNEHAHLIA